MYNRQRIHVTTNIISFRVVISFARNLLIWSIQFKLLFHYTHNYLHTYNLPFKIHLLHLYKRFRYFETVLQIFIVDFNYFYFVFYLIVKQCDGSKGIPLPLLPALIRTPRLSPQLRLHRFALHFIFFNIQAIYMA